MEAEGSQKVGIVFEAKIEDYLRALDRAQKKIDSIATKLDTATKQYNNNVKRTLLGSRTAFRAFAADIGIGSVALAELAASAT